MKILTFNPFEGKQPQQPTKEELERAKRFDELFIELIKDFEYKQKEKTEQKIKNWHEEQKINDFEKIILRNELQDFIRMAKFYWEREEYDDKTFIKRYLNNDLKEFWENV